MADNGMEVFEVPLDWVKAFLNPVFYLSKTVIDLGEAVIDLDEARRMVSSRCTDFAEVDQHEIVRCFCHFRN